jgi:hypothetical protein
MQTLWWVQNWNLRRIYEILFFQNFTLISNPLKKLLKNAHKESYKQNKFDEHE